MAIVINNFEIINNGTQLAIDVETGVGFNITSIMLWKMNDFKDYSLAYNLEDHLEQINNREVFILEGSEIGSSILEDIYFIEVDSNEPDEDECTSCQDPTLAITYNLSPYYQCLLNEFLTSQYAYCDTCDDIKTNELAITISLLIESVENAIELGLYTQAVSMIAKLKKLCSIRNCDNCKPVSCTSCSKFKQY